MKFASRSVRASAADNRCGGGSRVRTEYVSTKAGAATSSVSASCRRRSISALAGSWWVCHEHMAATMQLVSGRNKARVALQARGLRSRLRVWRVRSTVSAVSPATFLSGTATSSRPLRTSFTGRGAGSMVVFMAERLPCRSRPVSLDHPIGLHENGWRDLDVQGRGGLQVDGELQLRGLLNRKAASSIVRARREAWSGSARRIRACACQLRAASKAGSSRAASLTVKTRS